MGADGEDSIAGPRQHHVVVADMTEQCAAVSQRIDGDTKGKVGSLRTSGVSLRHFSLQAAEAIRSVLV
jgi:hypothetical protein